MPHADKPAPFSRRTRRPFLPLGFLACLFCFVDPALAYAAGAPLNLPVWTVAPFILLLLAIAILPLAAGHFWHSNARKLLVTALIALPTAGYLYLHQLNTGEDAVHELLHAVQEYASFMLLLGSLFTVSGGILLRGDVLPRPAVNTGFLALGALLANLIGTTGASMLLIRPLLRINRHRRNVKHLPIFFIFIVSNVGGLLTPLGDPPLFLGFLHQVPFTWTLGLWPQWLFVNGILLLLFYCGDTVAFRREAPEGRSAELLGQDVLHLNGKLNFLFLGGIVAAVLLQSRFEDPWGPVFGGATMLLMAILSLLFTRRALRLANFFTWRPILEVAILFAGIFVTMVPALVLLATHRDALGVDQAWQYFWLSGGLSSFLDNAPTYLTFATMAAGSPDFSLLVGDRVAGIDGPLTLAAISCGAVFMGANTYIGNGPNFMVKAIADDAGYPTPSFFGYMAYSGCILLPIFAALTPLFFGR
jgi:Na+/H+ antiporter NhaD/arsenite permease-like protein